ncbi:MAG: hypothetical protein ABIT20_02840 [Gemmatimonadaceae bacterium]
MVIVVPSMTWDIVPISLALTWAMAGIALPTMPIATTIADRAKFRLMDLPLGFRFRVC